MRNSAGRRFRRSNLVWVVGVAAGLLAGAMVAYGLGATSVLFAGN